MSGVNGHGAPQAGFGPAGLQGGSESDPSMEDILASIRRILSEDETLADKPSAGTPPQHEVLNLDESMLVSAPKRDAASRMASPASPFGMIVTPEKPEAAAPATPAPASTPPEVFMTTGTGGARSADHRNGAAEPGAAEPGAAKFGAAEPGAAEPGAGEAPLVAQSAGDAASASMGALMRTLAAERQVAVYRGGPTLEDMVRDEMRPLLKEWLDTNLPALVERVVRAEIERVSKRAAG